MKYSRKFDPGRLPACFGAIQATYPDLKLEVKKSSTTKGGEGAYELLRSKWESFIPINLLLHEPSGFIDIEIKEVWDLISVDIEGGSEEVRKRLHELVHDSLGLVDPSEEELESEGNLYAINQRILKVQKLVMELPAKLEAASTLHKLRCFVSFRFDEHSKALALELSNFLELAGLEFISGLGYEPRSVSEKVLERLTGKIDLFIVISALGGDSTWLHQEIGVAKGRSLPVMVLREEGTHFEEGILSDTEYASFPKGQISGAFISVLQAVQYIRLRTNAT